MKILFLLLLTLLFLPFVLTKKIGNQIYVISIMVLIALNLNYQFFIDSQLVQIPLLFFYLIFTIPFLYLKNNHLVIKYKKYILGIFLLINTIIFILILQFYYLELYDLRLYFKIFFSYMNVLLLLLVFLLNTNRISEDFYLRVIACFSLANSILGVLQFIFNRKFLIGAFNENIEYYEGLKVIKRVVGFVGANNGAGNLGAILFPILFYYFLKKKNAFSLMVLVLNIVFTVLTFTRAGYLSIAVVCICYFLYYISRKNSIKTIVNKFVLTNTLIIAISVFILIFFDKFYKILFEYRGDTESYRGYQYGYAFQLIHENLIIGIGVGNFDYVVQQLFGVVNIGILHSQFLNIIVEQGLFSFILYIVFNIWLFILLRKEYNNSFSYFPYLIFIGYIIPINFNANQYYDINIYIFYVTIICLITSSKSSIREI